MEEKLLIIDCETTAGGSGSDVELFEVAFLDEEVSTFQMCPNKPILPSATVIHGCTNEDVKSYRPIEDVIQEVYAYLRKTITPATCVTAYNTSFDFEVIDRAFKEYLGKSFAPKNTFDTLRLAQKIVPVERTGNHRLDTIFYYLFPDELKWLLSSRNSHSADTDVDITSRVISGLWERLEVVEQKSFATIQEVCDYTNAPLLLSIWPFGKHRGDLIKDVLKTDSQYVSWFMKQDWCEDSPDLLYTIKKERGQL